MKNRFFLFFTIFIILISILTGCGGECKVDADCEAPNACTKAQCIDKECKLTPIKGCTCGDNECDASINENKCTCPEDCGKCGATKSESVYLKEQCFNTETGELCEGRIALDDPCECYEDIDQSQIETETSSISARTRQGTFEGTVEYQQPFDLKRSTFKIKELKIKDWDEDIDKISLNNIEVYGTRERTEIKLGSKETQKILWDGTSVDEEVILDNLYTEEQGMVAALRLVVYYSYILSGKEETSQFEQKFRMSELEYIKPTIELNCKDEDCDDDNPGTKDYCLSSNTAFCLHEPLPNKCGNYICDTKEDKCTCPSDCGPCQGNIGEYMYYDCVDNVCNALLNPKTDTVKEIEKVVEGGVRQYDTDHVFKYDYPYADIRTSSIKLKLVLKDITNEYGGIKIKSISGYDGDIRWIHQNIGTTLSTRDQSIDIVLPLKTIPMEERIKKLSKLKFEAEYEYPTVVRDEPTTNVGKYPIRLNIDTTLIKPSETK